MQGYNTFFCYTDFFPFKLQNKHLNPEQIHIQTEKLFIHISYLQH